MGMKRSANVELLRFMAALLIMGRHIYHIGILDHPFYDCWIYVEFFLLITGYFTARHFDHHVSEDKAAAAVKYTVKKFLPIVPYAVIASVLAWVTQGVYGLLFENWSMESFIDNFLGDFVFDLLLISGSYTRPLIAPLWYVSAMLIVFPLFALFVQLKNRYLRLILCTFVPIMYFGWVGVSGKRDFPHDMLRVFVGMMLGVVIYEITVQGKKVFESMNKLVLTVIEVLSIIFPIYACYNNWAGKGFTSARLYLLCFFVTLTLSLSGATYTSGIRGNVITYLGRLSMPLYVIHWYIGTLVNDADSVLSLSDPICIALYYPASIIAAMIFMAIIGRWKWFNNILRMVVYEK